MEEESFGPVPHPNFLENAKLFEEKYDVFKFVPMSDDDYSKRHLKWHTARTCRFCGRSYPETTFSTYAHILPKLIGNSNMYSDFECDECNAFFSGLENDLAAYLGLARSIVALHGKKVAPGFAARGMKIKSRSFIGENILILAPQDVKTVGNITSLTYTKNAFIPANVYKALLKSALSLLNDEDINAKYQRALAYLMGKIPMNRGAAIAVYRCSFNLNLSLHVYCFRRKVRDEEIPEHIMSFNFQDHIIVLPLPCDDRKGDWNVIVPPLYFLNKQAMENAHPVPYIRDLYSTLPVTDEEEILSFQVDPQQLENITAYDLKTNTYKQRAYNPDGTKYIILTRQGVSIDPKELSAFINEQMNVDEPY